MHQTVLLYGLRYSLNRSTETLHRKMVISLKHECVSREYASLGFVRIGLF